jgi:hypothetical protein
MVFHKPWLRLFWILDGRFKNPEGMPDMRGVDEEDKNHKCTGNETSGNLGVPEVRGEGGGMKRKIQPEPDLGYWKAIFMIIVFVVAVIAFGSGIRIGMMLSCRGG